MMRGLIVVIGFALGIATVGLLSGTDEVWAYVYFGGFGCAWGFFQGAAR